jgi:hypothetical protein
MIDNTTQPWHILVIDDNQVWLSHLERFGIKVLYCANMSLRGIENHLDENHISLKVVVIGANLRLGGAMMRTELKGFELGKDIFISAFPKLSFIFLSFQFKEIAHGRVYCYTDFLHQLIAFVNGRK